MSAEALLKMAQRASENEMFIAYLIHFYIQNEGINWHSLSEKIGLSTLQLSRLALCKRPRRQYRREDLEKISKFVDVDTNQIASFITKMENLLALSASNSSQFLMAARDTDLNDEG